MGCAEKFGQTLMVVTHNSDVASKADCVLCIEDGKLVNEK